MVLRASSRLRPCLNGRRADERQENPGGLPLGAERASPPVSIGTWIVSGQWWPPFGTWIVSGQWWPALPARRPATVLRGACMEPVFSRPAVPKNPRSGMTLVELIVAFTILMILTTMAVPLARSNVRRHQERDLRLALEQIRAAIDKYKDAADGGKLGPDAIGIDTFGYPKTLESLVEGVKGTGQGADTKLKFLRRIHMDPFTRTREWSVRSMQDDPKSTGWGGQNVFDVYTKSTEKAADGTPYADW